MRDPFVVAKLLESHGELPGLGDCLRSTWADPGELADALMESLGFLAVDVEAEPGQIYQIGWTDTNGACGGERQAYWEQFCDTAAGRTLVAHNALSWDKVRLAEQGFEPAGWLDTLRLHSLAFPRQRLSLALQGPHHAVGDAEATWRTLREQVECLLLRPAEHLQEWAEWTENQTLRDFLAKVGLCQPLARKLLPGDEKETEARSQPATDLPVTLVIAPQVAWRPYFDRAYTQCWQPGKAAPLCNALAYICPQAVRARLRKGKTPDIGLYLDAFLKDAEAQHFSNAEVTLPPWPAHWFREAIEGGEIAEVRRDCTVCDQTTCPFHVAQARTLVADYRTATCLPDGFVPQEVIVDRPYQALTDVEEPVPLAVERSDLPVTVCDKLTARGLVRIPLTLEEVNSLILNGKEGMRYWLETGLPGREERLRIISSPTDPWQRACNEITFPNQCLGSGEIV